MKILQVELQRVYISDKSKDGKPFVARNGKSFKKIAIQTSAHGSQWLSSFIFRDDDVRLNWTEKNVVEIIEERNGQYLNFTIPTRLDRLEVRIEKLESKTTPPPTIPGANDPSLGDEEVEASPEDAFDPESLPF